MPAAGTDYGQDAPKVVRNLFVIGLLCLVLVFIIPLLSFITFVTSLQSTLFVMGLVLIGEAGLMVLYSRKGKFKHRGRILNMYQWRGDEKVLDVGTGLGLLMIGAAQRLTTGRVTGIDIWNQQDLSNNTALRAQKNAVLERVADKIAIENRNILESGLPDASFDVVLSNLCLHNIYNKAGRQKACQEIYRLLKPGGTAILSDFKHNGEYRKALEQLGMQVEKHGPYFLDTFPPLTILYAKKI